jgi:hypothetical protein
VAAAEGWTVSAAKGTARATGLGVAVYGSFRWIGYAAATSRANGVGQIVTIRANKWQSVAFDITLNLASQQDLIFDPSSHQDLIFNMSSQQMFTFIPDWKQPGVLQSAETKPQSRRAKYLASLKNAA